MTEKERKSCICTIKMLRNLAFNVHGVMDVIDYENCEKMISLLESFEQTAQPSATDTNVVTTDTISRQAAIDALDKRFDSIPMEQTTEILLLRKYLRNLPFVQPERKKGHWIEVNDSYNRISGRCSVCGWESHMYEDDVVGMDFCPNCGARLDGEQDG